MKYEVVITDSAALDLAGIVDYIARTSAARANECHDKIIAKLKKLEAEPFLGRLHTVKKLKTQGWRELILQSHIAHYKVEKDKLKVNIIRVLHQSMNQPKHLKQEP